MNNCPKCGNPLQPGVTSCPICGTNLGTVEAKNMQKTVASVAAPVQNAQPAQTPPTQPAQKAVAAKSAPQPASPKPEATPQAISTQPVNPQPAPVQNKPVEQPAKSVQQAPAAQPAAPAQTAAPAPQPAAPAPAPQVVSDAAPVQVSESVQQVQPVVVNDSKEEVAAELQPTPVVAEPVEPEVTSGVVEPPVVVEEETPASAPQSVGVENFEEKDLAQAVEEAQQVQADVNNGSVQVVVEDSNVNQINSSETPVTQPVGEVVQPTIVSVQPEVVNTPEPPVPEVAPVLAPQVVSVDAGPIPNEQAIHPTIQPIQPSTPQLVQSSTPQQVSSVQPQLVLSQQIDSSVPVPNIVNNQVPPAPVVPVNNSTATPIPSVPSSLSNNAPVALQVQSQEEKKKGKKEKVPKEKKGFNKTLLVILIVVIAAAAVGAFVLLNGRAGTIGGDKKPAAPLSGSTVSSNGFKFSLAEGWIVTEGNGNVIITNANDDSTVQMKLSNSVASIEYIDEETINKYVAANDKIKNSKVEEMTISAKKTYLLSATFNDLPIQVYFIGGGSKLVIGATVVYSSNDSKTKHEATVQEMIGTISYSDDTVKALDIVEMYGNIFSIYNGVVATSQNPSAFVADIEYTNPEVIDSNGEDNQVVDNGEVIDNNN